MTRPFAHPSVPGTFALPFGCQRDLPYVPDRRNLFQRRRHGPVRGAARGGGNGWAEHADGTAAHQHWAWRDGDVCISEQPSRWGLRLLRMRPRADGAYAHAYCDAGICRARAHRAGFRDSKRLPPDCRRDAELCRLRPMDLWTVADRRHERHISQRIRHHKCRNQFQRQRHHVDASRTNPELPGTVVERFRIGLGNQFRALGRPGVRDLVHLRHERQGWWLSMLAARTTGNTYTGAINVDSGPPSTISLERVFQPWSGTER